MSKGYLLQAGSKIFNLVVRNAFIPLSIKKLLWALYHQFLFAYQNFSPYFNKKTEEEYYPLPNALEPKNLKLQLGGDKLDGFTYIAQWKIPEADILRNIEKGLPFSESTVEEVYIEDDLIYARDLIFAMNEIHRVCVPNALVRITVPTMQNLWNFRDPTQCRFFNEYSFDYFMDENNQDAVSRGVEGFYEGVHKRVERKGGRLEILLKVKKEERGKQFVKKIDLGCGFNKKEGYTGIDIRPLEGANIMRDIENRGLPFSDSTIEYVYASHFLEHTKDLIFIMNEIYRVCRNNAIVEIRVPTLLSRWGMADPSHLRFFNVHTFQHYFGGNFIQEERTAGIHKGFQIIEQKSNDEIYVKMLVLKPEV